MERGLNGVHDLTVESSSDRWSDRGRPWWRAVGLILMLPIGLIVALVLLLFFAGNGGYYRGELWVVLLGVFLVMFLARVTFRRSRRRYWAQQRERNGPVRILRERYARGEITKEQFDSMMRDLEQRR